MRNTNKTRVQPKLSVRAPLCLIVGLIYFDPSRLICYTEWFLSEDDDAPLVDIGRVDVTIRGQRASKRIRPVSQQASFILNDLQVAIIIRNSQTHRF